MELLTEYLSAKKKLYDYFPHAYDSYPTFGYLDSFWYGNEDSVGWSDNLVDLRNQTGLMYLQEVRSIHRGADYTMVVVRSDFGDGDEALIFDNAKETNFEEE